MKTDCVLGDAPAETRQACSSALYNVEIILFFIFLGEGLSCGEITKTSYDNV